jgi:pilus assembly protein Flp/PilA
MRYLIDLPGTARVASPPPTAKKPRKNRDRVPSSRSDAVVQEKGGEMQMLNLYMKLRSLTTRQEGQGMVEYALILVLVSIVVIVILLTMGNQIKNVFSNVVAALG